MAVNTSEIVIGRLVEITADAGYHSPEDVDAMIAMIAMSFTKLPASTMAVVVADWRGVHLMKPETAARAHAMLTRASPRIERSAILVSSASSTEMLQFVRLVRESHHPGRRIFDSPSALESWVAEILSPSERRRAATFLSRPAP